MAGRPFQSQLEPYYEFICELRTIQRKTWAEVALALEKAHGVKTSPQAVFAFFKRRLKRRAPLGWPVSPSSSSTLALSPVSGAPVPTPPLPSHHPGLPSPYPVDDDFLAPVKSDIFTYKKPKPAVP